MKATIGVYDTHDAAVEAVKKLKDSGYPIKHVSIIGKAETEVVDNEMHVTTKSPVNIAGVSAGTTLGLTLGILTGVGIFAIPGLGFLYGAGALVGAIAGFDFGLIGGGIASVLTSVGIEEAAAKKYHDALEGGHYLVIAQGSDADINNAKNILTEHGTHVSLTSH